MRENLTKGKTSEKVAQQLSDEHFNGDRGGLYMAILEEVKK